MTDRALAFPAAPLWRGSVSPGLSSNALPDRAGAAPAADQGLSPSAQYGLSPVPRKVRPSFRIAANGSGPSGWPETSSAASPESIIVDMRVWIPGSSLSLGPLMTNSLQPDPGALDDLAPFL